MKYRLLIARPAIRDLRQAYHWIAQDAPGRAETWLDGALRAIRALESLPARCPLAPENDAFEPETRQLLYGDYRILFQIESDTVRVLHVRHGARRALDRGDLGDG